MDFKQVAQTLLDLAGGTGNVSSITHCSTRLRFFIRDKSKVDTGTIGNTNPVLGVVFKGDELQIVLGQNLIPVYTEASKIYDASGSAGAEDSAPKEKEKLTAKGVVDIVVGFVSASVTPLIPGLVAGGMLKVFLLLITLAYAPFEETQAYTLLSIVSNTPFYFMPIFVAYGAAKKLGSTPLYAMAVAATLVYPDFVSLIGGDVPVTMFGLPVMSVNYSSTLLPALLIALFAYFVEKLFTKIIPGILRSVFVGMLTMAVTLFFGITILGPLGDVVGSYIVNVFLFASEHFGPVAIGLLAACMPWLVMTGMHHAVTPFMVQTFADPCYDVFFRPSYILHNMAEGGACLGVALRAKDKTVKAECFSLAFGCIVAGVTEPAVYGVNFRLKKPMIAIMAGGAAGGIVAGLLGATAYVYGYSTILALPIFQDTMFAMAAGIAVDIVVAAIVTFILGFDESILTAGRVDAAPASAKVAAPKAVSAPTSASAPEAISIANKKPLTIYAPFSGTAMRLEDIPDPVFSQGVLGPGCGVEPTEETVYAPFDGEITQVTDTKHAIGITSDDGMELLIHVGMDTVDMGGRGFTRFVEEGMKVKAGQPMMTFSFADIKAAGHPATTAVVLTNADDYNGLELLVTGEVQHGAPLVKVDK